MIGGNITRFFDFLESLSISRGLASRRTVERIYRVTQRTLAACAAVEVRASVPRVRSASVGLANATAGKLRGPWPRGDANSGAVAAAVRVSIRAREICSHCDAERVIFGPGGSGRRAEAGPRRLQRLVGRRMKK